MYTRLLNPSPDHSFFLFGPRGTGKTTWIRNQYPQALYLDLLETKLYTELIANPSLLSSIIPPNHSDYIIIDEVQRIPELLNEVHRLIESQEKYKFILTGSNARKLRRQGTNLLAGRAFTYNLYPLTAPELGNDFNLTHALRYGGLPTVWRSDNPTEYLASYVSTYLEQEIIYEGMTRQLASFYRFLQVASFSQGSQINTSEIAREVGVGTKVVDNYFSILQDLLIGHFLPSFTKRAKRRLVSRPKFYFIDPGIYQAIRPTGYLDKTTELDGIALETLFFNHLTAINDYHRLAFKLFFFRTASGQEIDFIAYGKSGLFAFEIKHGSHFSRSWTKSLVSFSQDYPEAKLFLIYTGDKTLYHKNITILPITQALTTLPALLTTPSSH